MDEPSELRCGNCGKLLAEAAGGGTRLKCGRCKAVNFRVTFYRDSVQLPED